MGEADFWLALIHKDQGTFYIRPLPINRCASKCAPRDGLHIRKLQPACRRILSFYDIIQNIILYHNICILYNIFEYLVTQVMRRKYKIPGPDGVLINQEQMQNHFFT